LSDGVISEKVYEELVREVDEALEKIGEEQPDNTIVQTPDKN
jgi:hypothetical protein